MIATLPRPLRRALSVMLLILPPLAVYSLIVMPLIDAHRAGREAIADLRYRTARYSQIASEGDALERRLEALRSVGEGDDGYLEGANETLVGAALQSRMKTLIEEAGGAVRTSQILSPREEAGVVQVTVRLDSTQTTEALAQTLAAISAGPPVLLVEQLDVRVRPPVSADGGEQIAEPLEVRLDVTGFMRLQAP